MSKQLKNLLVIFLLLFLVTACSDFTTEATEFELSGKSYACDGDIQGEIINDSKTGKRLYCNGYRWIAVTSAEQNKIDTIASIDSAVQTIPPEPEVYECKNGSIVTKPGLCDKSTDDYLLFDDTEFPYAGIPRIVIETENHREIKDRETEIPAKLQIWGENAPESEIMELTIRGRGNSSWNMPKKSYKIEFLEKQSILEMPKDKDWALISNYADKSLLKNYLMYTLASNLGTFYAPRCKFVEVFLNKDYLGVYLITETIKSGKNRVNIQKGDFILEIDGKVRNQEQQFKTDVFGKTFKVHEPHNLTKQELDSLAKTIRNFELNLTQIAPHKQNSVEELVNLKEFITHYWVQEFSKNPDANFHTSVYVVVEKNTPPKMGPVWDFDLSMGGHDNKSIYDEKNWHIKGYWYSTLFRDSVYKQKTFEFWQEKHPIFEAILDSIDSLEYKLTKVAQNNFKKWNILATTDYRYHPQSFTNYQECTDFLKTWLSKRIEWIDNNVGVYSSNPKYTETEHSVKQI